MHCFGRMERDREMVIQHVRTHSHTCMHTQTRISEINYLKPYLLKLLVTPIES
jgi:hypothetical protein